MSEKVLLNEYPSNSNKSKERKQLEPVTNGSKKPPGIWKQIKSTFLADDISDVKEYLFFDVLLPAVKDTLVDMGKTAIDMIFYGDTKSSSKSKKPYRVSYSSYYENDRPKSKSSSRKDDFSSFDDIEIDTKGEAEEVLDQLSELILEYGYARVADLYDLCNIPDSFTDNNYGWTSLEKASTSRIRRNGEFKYILNLPKPELLD